LKNLEGWSSFPSTLTDGKGIVCYKATCSTGKSLQGENKSFVAISLVELLKLNPEFKNIDKVPTVQNSW
jgi:hypothetical protein